MPFKKLEIIEPILEALKSKGYEKPSPIQEEAIPILLSGKDIMGSAQTGTGKTAAFAIPILQSLYKNNNKNKNIKALILTPTRELAMQIKVSFDNYGKNLPLRAVMVFGGIKQKSQIDNLRRGCDILVATPGRLLDLMGQGLIRLSEVQYLVLDEADKMLDMGFIKDVKRIIAKVPNKRQTMLFSATLDKNILNLADSILTNPERIQITPVEATLDTIKQSVYYVKENNKFKLLLNILKKNDYKSILVFTRTKRNANKVAKLLMEKNISALPIHGNKSQNARTEALRQFKLGNVRVLVATDLAARGLDINDLSLVVNYNLPNVAETYIHRIGRTGRANKKGEALSFCNEEEVELLENIQKHINMYITINENHPYYAIFSEKAATSKNNSNNSAKKSRSLNVQHHKKRITSTKSTKNKSTLLTDKIKNSGPKKKKSTTKQTRKNWTKAKPKPAIKKNKDFYKTRKNSK